MRKIVVGIAAGRKYNNYLNWLSQASDVEVIKLSHEDKNFESISHCDGIMLTGGEDVHPRFYNKPEYLEKYHLDDIDEARDEFELNVLEYTIDHHLPLLGICRGLQLANAYFGGTLIPDIISSGKPDHTKYQEGKDRYHEVLIENETFLMTISGTAKGEINSAHHQSVDRIGKGLVVNAVSPDGIIEGMERSEVETNPFFLLVQWHPERMIDQKSPLSKNVIDHFLKAMKLRVEKEVTR